MVGVKEAWGRELPGVIGDARVEGSEAKEKDPERMKIAWRYERLGEFGVDKAAVRRGAWACPDSVFHGDVDSSNERAFPPMNASVLPVLHH